MTHRTKSAGRPAVTADTNELVPRQNVFVLLDIGWIPQVKPLNPQVSGKEQASIRQGKAIIGKPWQGIPENNFFSATEYNQMPQCLFGKTTSSKPKLSLGALCAFWVQRINSKLNQRIPFHPRLTYPLNGRKFVLWGKRV